MVNTRSGNARQRDDQDASVMARVIAPSERGPQTQEENQEANSKFSTMAETQQMFREMAEKNREQIHKIIEEKMGSTQPPVCSYKTFLSSQPPEFSGSTDPTAILNWIINMELAFESCECEETQKVKFAVRMLKGSAMSWWNVTRVLLGKEIVSHLTWGDFVEKIKKRYCSSRDLWKMQKEFFMLEKGDMTIDEYACLFVEKLQHVGDMAPNDMECVTRFVAGLPLEYKLAVIMPENLDSAIQAAKRVEENENEKEKEEDFGEKRKWGGTFGAVKKSKWEDKTCYQCGKVGHLARECRTRL